MPAVSPTKSPDAENAAMVAAAAGTGMPATANIADA
jgi:hypothetical protein